VRVKHWDGRKEAPTSEAAGFMRSMNEAPLGHHVATARKGVVRAESPGAGRPPRRWFRLLPGRRLMRLLRRHARAVHGAG
jgi:hypothetical protein